MDLTGPPPAQADADSRRAQFLELVRGAVAEGASDLHFREGQCPRVRIDGELYTLSGPPTTQEELRTFLLATLNAQQIERFERTRELDFASTLPGVSRMRFNLYVQQGMLCTSVRLLPELIPSMEEIRLPPAAYAFVNLHAGLILVTGPTGSGKSTTLAAMLDHINANRRAHILTIEDPVEYLFVEKSCMVSQREMSLDTNSYHAALRHAFRQDPDVVMIGEMRDLETMQAAITAAETGHLVFATLHTTGAASTVDRIVDAFPTDQQEQVRMQLSVGLVSVISQVLMPRADKPGRVAAFEIMVSTPGIAAMIRDGNTHRITSDIQTGAKFGMQTLDSHLLSLYVAGRIGYDELVTKSRDVDTQLEKIKEILAGQKG